MHLFATSKDILFIVLAASSAFLTFFFCWMLFYLIMSFHQVYKMTKDARQIVDDAGKTVRLFKEKVENSASYLLLIGEGMKKIIEFMKEREEKKESKNS